MRICIIVALCAITLGQAADAPKEITVTQETVTTFYRSYHRLTKTPHHVAPLTALLCGGPTARVIEREKLATGPHYDATVHLYASPLADASIKQRAQVFPVGSVIVKEKLGSGGAVTGVGGMIKRAPGYDTANGDWEYFYSDKVAGFSSGRMQNCVSCHAETAKTDYVYSVWKAFDY